MVDMPQSKLLPAYDLLRRSLYGARIEVIAASNPKIIGLNGKLVNETRNTITIKNGNNNEKVIEKKSCSLKISLHDYQPVVIQGKFLQGRLDERLKKYTRKK
jgi:ribonuclease P protein subunit POP4